MPFLLAFGVMGLVGWRTLETRQQQSAAYERAMVALDAGSLSAAIDHFGEAGTYRDARDQRIAAQELLAPYKAAFLEAQSALASGDNEHAVGLLRSVVAAMPENSDAAALLVTAETRYRTDLQRAISVATVNHDWLEVEHSMLTLSQMSGSPPDDIALTELRLAHAPLLFTRAGSLFQVGPDQADERLIFSGIPVSAPLWSPDRSQIAFFSALPASERFAALYVVDADGANLRLLDEKAIKSLPAWSPDGAQLAYVGADSDAPASERSTLRLVSLASGESRTVPLASHLLGAVSPSWSGDGLRLAAVGLRPSGANDILIIDGETLEATSLLEKTPPNARSVSWSPTADALLLWTTTNDSDWYAIRGSTVYLISIEDRTATPVTMASQAPSRPVWSSDGVRYAYLERGATLHVRVRTGIGERVLELPNKGDGKISWAPGGVGIAVPALDLAEPSMIVPVGERLGPAELLVVAFEDSLPATDFLWAPYTAPAESLYDPFAATPVAYRSG